MPDATSTKPPTNASFINEEHRSLVLELKKSHVNRGPAQVQNQLRRFHAIKISRQMIGRIFAEAGIPLQKPAGAKEKGDPADNRFEMSRPNELWAVDFKEFWIHAEKAFGLFVIDDFSRFCVGFALTQTPTADLAIDTVNAAIQRYGRPERILEDKYTKQLEEYHGQLTISVDTVSKYMGQKPEALEVEHLRGSFVYPEPFQVVALDTSYFTIFGFTFYMITVLELGGRLNLITRVFLAENTEAVVSVIEEFLTRFPGIQVAVFDRGTPYLNETVRALLESHGRYRLVCPPDTPTAKA